MAFWVWLSFLLALLLLITASLSSMIRIRIRYLRSGNKDRLVIIVHALFGLYHKEIVVPAIAFRDGMLIFRENQTGGMAGLGGKQNDGRSKRISWRTVRRYRRSYALLQRSIRQFSKWARHTMKDVDCTRWRMDFHIGTGDAAETAVVAGLLCAVSGCAAGIAGRWVKLHTMPQSRVTTNYVNREFAVVWEADFQMRTYRTTLAVLRLFTRTIKWKQALRAWRRFRLSRPAKA